LQACLEKLSRGFPPDGEVIVVSDGGDPELFPNLERFEARLNLRIIHAEHGGPASARNHGLTAVSAPIVLFLDDDCLPEPGWVEAMAATVQLEPPTAIGGQTINGLPDNPYATTAQLILDLIERDQRALGYPAVFYPCNNIGFPVATLKQLGGFDAGFRTAEDRELCRRWRQAGHELVKAPQAVLAHAPDMNFAGFWHKYVSYGEGAAHFHEDEPEDLGSTMSYHFRIPSLLAAEFRENKRSGRLGIYLLVLTWEFANLFGYLKARIKRSVGKKAK